MSVICSITRITSDPEGAAEVMLDFGDDVAAEPSVPSAQAVQTARYPGAKSAGHFSRGNNEAQLSWSRIFYFDTNQQARMFGLAAVANAPWGRKAPMDIEYDDGSRVRVHGVVIESVEHEPLTEAGSAGVIIRYEAVGGDVSIEASGGFSDGNWSAQDQTWAAWSDKFSKVI